jgi:pimeloyl-ACP methyl ester carboxylesterase
LDEAQRWRNAFGCVQELTVLPGLGHCPHDEAPELVNPILQRWLLEADPQHSATGTPAVG